VKCIRATIPYTWFNVLLGENDSLVYTGSNSGLHSLVIDAGNYTGASLATYLTTVMSAASAPDTVTVTYSDTTHKFTFTATEQISIDFTVANNIHLILGFNEVATVSAFVLISPNVAGFVTDTNIYIKSSLVSGIDNGFIPLVGGAPVNGQILYSMPISGCFGAILQSCNSVEAPYFPVTNSIFSLVDPPTPRITRFWLEFPSGGEVDLNGFEWEIVLVFDFNSPISGAN
jgi:hypothetical protein